MIIVSSAGVMVETGGKTFSPRQMQKAFGENSIDFTNSSSPITLKHKIVFDSTLGVMGENQGIITSNTIMANTIHTQNSNGTVTLTNTDRCFVVLVGGAGGNGGGRVSTIGGTTNWYGELGGYGGFAVSSFNNIRNVTFSYTIGWGGSGGLANAGGGAGEESTLSIANTVVMSATGGAGGRAGITSNLSLSRNNSGVGTLGNELLGTIGSTNYLDFLETKRKEILIDDVNTNINYTNMYNQSLENTNNITNPSGSFNQTTSWVASNAPYLYSSLTAYTPGSTHAIVGYRTTAEKSRGGGGTGGAVLFFY